MKTIYKYPLTASSKQVVQLPASSMPLSVQFQQGSPCLWALVDTEQPLVDYVVRTYGTGHEIDELSIGFEFLGTLQAAGGDLVFHFFGYFASLALPADPKPWYLQ